MSIVFIAEFMFISYKFLYTPTLLSGSIMRNLLTCLHVTFTIFCIFAPKLAG